MTQLVCSQCRQPVQAGWRACPYCGQSLFGQAPAAPVALLACPACGGNLPLPTITTEYLTCPYCRSSLHLRRASHGYILELAQQIGREVGQQVRAELHQQEERRYARARQAKRSAEGREMVREALGMYLTCVALYAFILGFFPIWATGAVGLVLIAGAVAGALFTILLDTRRGASMGRSLLLVGITGVVVFGVFYGFKWYFLDHLMNSGPLFRFPTPTPRP